MRQVWPDQVERAAAATWMRCRTITESKDKTAWHDLSEEKRQAWRDGARYTLEAATRWPDGCGPDPTLS